MRKPAGIVGESPLRPAEGGTGSRIPTFPSHHLTGMLVNSERRNSHLWKASKGIKTIFISFLTPDLKEAGLLDAARGAWADRTIIHCKDRPAARYLTTDAYSGDRLRINSLGLDLDDVEIGDVLTINGTEHDLVERRMIAHQGPVFVLGRGWAAQRARSQRLLLHDVLSGRDHDVDLCGKALVKLDAGDEIRVDGAAHVVSGRLSDDGGETILTVPKGPVLMDWTFRSAVVLRFAERHMIRPNSPAALEELVHSA